MIEGAFRLGRRSNARRELAVVLDHAEHNNMSGWSWTVIRPTGLFTRLDVKTTNRESDDVGRSAALNIDGNW